MRSNRTRAAGLAAMLALAAIVATAPTAPGQQGPAPKAKKTAKAKKAAEPAGPPPPATPVDRLKGLKGFKVELLYSVPRDDAGVVGQPDGRPQGPADRLRPVRQALPGHAPGRSARRPRRSRSSRSPSRSARRRGCSGRSTSLYVVVNAGGKFQSGLYRVTRHQRRRRARQGRAAPQARRQRRARPARGRPRARRQVALRRRRQRDQAFPSWTARSCRGIWGEDHLLPRDGRRPRLHGQRERPRRLRLPGRPRRQGLGPGVDGLPQRLRHGLQPRRRPVHLRLRHGVGHEHSPGIARRGSATSVSGSDFGYRNGGRASGRPITSTASRPSSTSGPARPPA